MNLKPKELNLILKWFSIAEDSLSDDDLELYDKIKESVEECEVDGEDSSTDLYFEPPDEDSFDEDY